MTDYTHIIADDLDNRILDGKTQGDNRYDALELTIRDNGDVALGVRYVHDNSTSFDRHDNIELVYVLAEGWCRINGERLFNLLKEGGEIAVLIDRIKAGFESEWNGSKMVGRIKTDDAMHAHEDLVDLVDGRYGSPGDKLGVWSEVSVWSAYEWMFGAGDGDFTVSTTDEQIEAMANEFADHARCDDVIFDENSSDRKEALVNAIKKRRDELRDEADGND